MIMRSLVVACSLAALTAAARADESVPPAPPEPWQTRCADAFRAAKDEMMKRELISEPAIAIGDFALPDDSDAHAPMVKLEYFVSHGLAVTIYVWRSERAGKTTGWRDVDEQHNRNAVKLVRDRGRMHAQLLAGHSTNETIDVKTFRRILTKAGDACLK
jgi:hypothetical protein